MLPPRRMLFLSKSFVASLCFLLISVFVSILPSSTWISGSQIHMQSSDSGTMRPVTATVKLTLWEVTRTWDGQTMFQQSWQDVCKDSRFFEPAIHRLCTGMLLGQTCQLSAFIFISMLLVYLGTRAYYEESTKGASTNKVSLVLGIHNYNDDDAELDSIERLNASRKYRVAIALLIIMTASTLCFLAWGFLASVSEINARVYFRGVDVKSIDFSTGYYATFFAVLCTMVSLAQVLLSQSNNNNIRRLPESSLNQKLMV